MMRLKRGIGVVVVSVIVLMGLTGCGYEEIVQELSDSAEAIMSNTKNVGVGGFVLGKEFADEHEGVDVESKEIEGGGTLVRINNSEIWSHIECERKKENGKSKYIMKDSLEINTNQDEIGLVMDFMYKFYNSEIMYSDYAFNYKEITWEEVLRNVGSDIVNKEGLVINVLKIDEDSKKVSISVTYSLIIKK